MKTMCPHGYHHNDLVATRALCGNSCTICCAHLAFVRFEHSVCREQLIITYITLLV